MDIIYKARNQLNENQCLFYELISKLYHVSD